MNKKITENDLYAKLRKEREELYKIIGKEGITDQKVRIDKYAHLYVLQDEMTEYLRARRLSQAEIEKLYAVEISMSISRTICYITRMFLTTHIKNVLILFFIQRTEKRSLGGECHALPI